MFPIQPIWSIWLSINLYYRGECQRSFIWFNLCCDIS